MKKDKFLYQRLADDSLEINVKFKKKLRKQLFSTKENIMAKNLQLTIKQLIHQKAFVYAGGFALLLLVVTTVYALDNRSTSLARQSIIDDTVALPQNLSELLSVEEMRTLAGADTPAGSSITQIEIENEHGTVLYKVKFSDGSFRLYDAKTGLAYVDAVSGVESNLTVPAGFVAGISVQQARDIAAAQRPGKTITKIELETEEGVVVYSVRFADDARVDINAANGAVVRIRNAGGSNSTAPSSDDSSDDDSSDDNSGSDSHNSGSSDDDGDDNSGSGHGGDNR